MMMKIATSLLACSLLAACQSTSATAQRPGRSVAKNLQQRMLAENQPYQSTLRTCAAGGRSGRCAGNRTVDPNRNPALLPSPLLRQSAAGGL